MRHAYAPKNRLWTSFLAINKMVKFFLKFSKIPKISELSLRATNFNHFIFRESGKAKFKS